MNENVNGNAKSRLQMDGMWMMRKCPQREERDNDLVKKEVKWQWDFLNVEGMLTKEEKSFATLTEPIDLDETTRRMSAHLHDPKKQTYRVKRSLHVHADVLSISAKVEKKTLAQ